MIPQSKCSTFSQKKEKFRRQIRAQYLQNYMAKIRTQLQHKQEYIVLRTIIDSIYNPDKFVNYDQKDYFRLKKVEELVSIANQGKNVAIVALGQLLLSQTITIQMIQAIPIKEPQNSLNSNNLSEKNNLMKVIKFPSETLHNQGWMAFIRILVNSNYCTEQMILYCIKTISMNKFPISLDFALQVIYILVIDKKMVKMQQIFELISSQKSEKDHQKPQKEKTTIENYLESLMNLSLKSDDCQESSQIRFHSTKILQKIFSNDEILELVILKGLSLNRIVIYLTQRFEIQSTRQKTKTLKLMNDLLVSLKEFRTYQVDQIIFEGLPLFQKIISEVMAISANIVKKKQGQLGYSHMLQLSNCSQKQEKELVKFIQENVFFVEVIIDNYLFTHKSLQTTNLILECFTLELILENLYLGFAEEVDELRNRDTFFGEKEFGESLAAEDKEKAWIVENVLIQARNLKEKVTNAAGNLSQQSQILDPFSVGMFLNLSDLIIARLDQSQINSKVHQGIHQKDIEI